MYIYIYILASLVDVVRLSAPRPGFFTPDKKNPVPILQEAAWALRASLNGYDEEKIPRSYQDLNPGPCNP